MTQLPPFLFPSCSIIVPLMLPQGMILVDIRLLCIFLFLYMFLHSHKHTM